MVRPYAERRDEQIGGTRERPRQGIPPQERGGRGGIGRTRERPRQGIPPPERGDEKRGESTRSVERCVTPRSSATSEERTA